MVSTVASNRVCVVSERSRAVASIGGVCRNSFHLSVRMSA